MGDTLAYLASRMLRLMGLWGCGDRGSDLHQIQRPVCPADRTEAEPAPLGMDVSELDLGIAHQPVAALGLGDADRFGPRESGDQRLADKDQLPAHLIWPLLRTRRTATSPP